MLTLYALKQSRAWRIAWLLELLGLDYQVELFERDAHTALAPAALRQLHPLGKSPLLRDGDALLAESGAIVEYLLARHGRGTALRPPPESPAYPAYLHWLHYAEGSLMPLLVMSLVLRKVEARPMPFFVRPVARRVTGGLRQGFVQPQTELHLGYVEQSLAGRRWLLGEQLSAADVMMSFPLQAALARTGLRLPHIAAYVARIEADPAWQRAEQRLGKLVLL